MIIYIRPMMQVETSKARMPTMSEMVTSPVSLVDPKFVVSPGYTIDQAPTITIFPLGYTELQESTSIDFTF